MLSAVVVVLGAAGLLFASPVAASSACFHEGHPWELPDVNVTRGYDAALDPSSLLAVLVGAMVLFRLFRTYRDHNLRHVLHPASRDVGLQRPAATEPSPLPVSDASAAFLVMFTLVDVFCRCAPFAHPSVRWAEHLSASWRTTFSPFLVNLQSMELYIGFVVFTGMSLVYIAWKGRHREDAFLETKTTPLKAVLPLDSWSSTSPTSSIRLAHHRHHHHHHRQPLSRWAPILVARLFQGPLFLPTAMLMLDSWTCPYSNRSPSQPTPTEFYFTSDCDSVLPCYEPGHAVMRAVSVAFLVLFFGLFVLPRRGPPSRHTLFGVNIPHLLPATVTLRLLLAWSGKILINFDTCSSLVVSLVSNTCLTALLALAVDSRRLDAHPTVLYVLFGGELWVLAYGTVANALFAVEGHANCALWGFVLAGAVLVWMFVYLYLRTVRSGVRAFAAPVFTTQPKPVVTTVGGRVEFVARAVGTPLPSLQWHRDGKPIPGQTRPTLILNAVRAEDLEVPFTCDATNSDNNGVRKVTTSAAGVVNYTPSLPVVVRQPPAFVVVTHRETCVLSVEASALPAPAYQWWRDGWPLDGETSASLSLVDVTSDAIGTFHCVVSNTVGSTKSRATRVAIRPYPPTVVPADAAGDDHSHDAERVMEVEYRAAVELSVAAHGFPIVAYQWQHDGNNVAGATASTFSIPSADADAQGVYVCVVSNQEGTATSRRTRVSLLPSAPSIMTHHSTPAAVDVGDTLTLLVEAHAWPAPEFQWVDADGADIPGATSTKYVVNNIQLHQCGRFRCVVTNSVGQAKSRWFDVQTSPHAPTVLSQPPRVVTPEGDATGVVLAVDATGYPAPTFTWTCNDQVVVGGTASALVLDPLREADKGVYTCTVENSHGSVTTTPTYVSFSRAPVIVTEPESVALTEENTQTATFTVDAVGLTEDVETYRWMKDGVVVPNQVSSWVTFPRVTFAMCGEVWCVVTNSAGSVESGHVWLSLPVTVEVTKQATPTTTTPTTTTPTTTTPTTTTPTTATPTTTTPTTTSPTTTMTLTTTVLGHRVDTYQWLRDGQPLDGATTPDLIVDTGDPSGFSCVVVTVDGETHTSNVVTVGGLTTPPPTPTPTPPAPAPTPPAGPPAITTQPQPPSGPLQEGGVFETEVAVDSTRNAVYSYQWMKDAEPLPGATSNRLVIDPVTAQSVGFYFVRITNTHDGTSVDSDGFSVELVPPPTAIILHQPPPTVRVLAGDFLTLSVEVAATSDPTYQWFRDGSAIDGETASVMTLAHCGLSTHSGRYWCVVSTSAVEALPSDSTLVTVVPSAVLDRVDAADGSNVVILTVRCVDSDEVVESCMWYKDAARVAGENASSLRLDGNHPDTFGTFTCEVLTTTYAMRVAEPVRVAPTPPVVTQAPMAVGLMPSAVPAFLRVVATGMPAPTYKWVKDGRTVPGATTSELKIPAATAEHEGQYACEVANIAGFQSTLPVDVRLVRHLPVIANGPPPSVTVGSADLTAEVTTTLSVRASAFPSPDYQWVVDGRTVPGVANRPTLTLSGRAESVLGTYVCEVSNDMGSVRTSECVVGVSPVVLRHPTSAVGVLGQPVALSCHAAGSPTPTLQWCRDGGGSTPIIMDGDTQQDLLIRKMQAEHVGRYFCVVTNACGSVQSSPAELTFKAAESPTALTGGGETGPPVTHKTAPKVLSYSPPTRLPFGTQSARLFVEVAGDPAPSVQWLHNDVEIPMATSAVLDLTNVDVDTAGEYKARVQNDVERCFSPPIPVAVTGHVVVTQQPSDFMAEPGQTVTLSVAVSVSGGTQPLRFLWRRHDGMGLINATGVTTPELTLSNMTADMAGEYVCVVSSSVFSVATNPAAVTLDSHPPVIRRHPDSVSVPWNHPVSLSIDASGVLTQYQWYHGDDGDDGVVIPGATSPEYRIPKLTEQTAGAYFCVVSNHVGHETSSNAIVSLRSSPPVVTRQPVCPTDWFHRDAVSLAIEASGVPAPTYRWQKNGHDMPGETSAVLTLPVVLASDAGTTAGSTPVFGVYTCVVSNPVGSATSEPVTVNPMGAPVFHKALASELVVPHGETVTLEAEAAGLPAPQYQWLRDGVELPGHNAARLVIARVTEASVGKYSCRCFNTVGTITTNASHVKLQPVPPKFTGQTDSMTAQEGHTVTLKVVVTGTPTPTLEWLLNGASVDGQTAAELTLTNLSRFTAGEYTVRATNCAGAELSAPILVTLKPQAPKFVDHSPAVTTSGGGGGGGGRVELFVKVTGTPLPGLQWYEGTTRIGDAHQTSLFVPADKVAEYTCVAENSVGTATSPVMAVGVGNTAPQFSKPLTCGTNPVPLGDALVLEVAVTGSPPPGLLWLKDGVLLPGQTDPRLVVSPFRSADAGRYVCRATNVVTTAESNEVVVVAGEPRIRLAVADRSLVSITLKWDELVVDHPVAQYRVTVAAVAVAAAGGAADPGDGDLSSVFLVTKREFMLRTFYQEPIDPNESFEFTVAARYEGARTDEFVGVCDPVVASTLPVSGEVALLPAPYRRIFLVEPLIFKSGGTRLRKKSQKPMEKVAMLLKQNAELQVEVQGHVNKGSLSVADALALSERRAKATVDLLEDMGVVRLRMVPCGKGFQYPRYPPRSANAHKNRRVEFRIFSKRELIARRRHWDLTRPLLLRGGGGGGTGGGGGRDEARRVVLEEPDVAAGRREMHRSLSDFVGGTRAVLCAQAANVDDEEGVEETKGGEGGGVAGMGTPSLLRPRSSGETRGRRGSTTPPGGRVSLIREQTTAETTVEHRRVSWARFDPRRPPEVSSPSDDSSVSEEEG